MLKLNSELRAVSRTTLSGNWMMAALATLVLSADSRRN